MSALLPWLRRLRSHVSIAVWLVGGLAGVDGLATAAAAELGSAASPSATSTALPGAIPFKREPESTYGDASPLPWMAVPLGALALLYIGVRVIRARRASSGAVPGEKLHGAAWRRALIGLPRPTEIRRVESTRLSPRHTLHVIEWQGRRLLVGCGEHSVHLLAEASGQASSAGETPVRDAGTQQFPA